MTRATCNPGHQNALRAVANGNTVVSSSDDGVGYLNICRIGEVDSVGEGAVTRCSDTHFAYIYVFAISNL